MGSTIKHAALSYARKGWKVFPISPNLKTPLAALAPQGHKNATSDQTTIEQWWSAHPDANIGLNLEASWVGRRGCRCLQSGTVGI